MPKRKSVPKQKDPEKVEIAGFNAGIRAIMDILDRDFDRSCGAGWRRKRDGELFYCLYGYFCHRERAEPPQGVCRCRTLMKDGGTMDPEFHRPTWTRADVDAACRIAQLPGFKLDRLDATIWHYWHQEGEFVTVDGFARSKGEAPRRHRVRKGPVTRQAFCAWLLGDPAKLSSLHTEPVGVPQSLADAEAAAVRLAEEAF